MIAKAQTKRKVVIIGGGYVGALSAILFSQNEDVEVTLVEKQNRLGGLYNNAWEFGGYSFDYGSRAIIQTGIKEIDNIFDQIFPSSNYIKSKKNLKEFSFQGGALREYSNCLDARLLDGFDRDLGISELINIKNLNKKIDQFDNLKTFSIANYGKTLTRRLIKPAIEKLTGIDMEVTNPNALSAHNIQRIIVADQEYSKILKSKSTFNDDRIAFARYDDHHSKVEKIYPKTGGLKDFGIRLLHYLNQKNNVKVILKNSVINLDSSGPTIRNVTLEDGMVLNADNIIWSVPSVFLSRLLSIDTSDLNSNEFRNLILAHYVFKGDVKTSAYYTYNYDPNFHSFRTSYYENYSDCPKSFSPITIESFCTDEAPNLDFYKIALFEEMREMNTISKNSKIIECKMHLQKRAVPNQSIKFINDQEELTKRMGSKFSNLTLLGGVLGSKTLLNNAYNLYKDL